MRVRPADLGPLAGAARRAGQALSTPITLARQAGLIGAYARLAGWRAGPFLRWATRWGNLFQAGAGATRIGCFGPAPHVVWEVTQRCNLRCAHCHASGGPQAAPDELTTAEARAFVDQVVEAGRAGRGARILVFSGGEPLMRPDLLDLIAQARRGGLAVFLATNGVLLDEPLARRLKALRVGVVIGLDAMTPDLHDEIRGLPGAWEGAIRGIETCARLGLYFHLNVVATARNLDEVGPIIDYGNRLGAYSHFVYRFVPVGRGLEADALRLDRAQLGRLLEIIADRQRHGTAIVIPVALPEFWARALRERGMGDARRIEALGRSFPGCQAGRGLTYVKPDGAVWACPFTPAEVGNVRREGLEALSRRLDEAFAAPACPNAAACPWGAVCGGCHACLGAGEPCALGVRGEAPAPRMAGESEARKNHG